MLDLSWNHLRRKGAVSISEAMEVCKTGIFISWSFDPKTFVQLRLESGNRSEIWCIFSFIYPSIPIRQKNSKSKIPYRDMFDHLAILSFRLFGLIEGIRDKTCCPCFVVFLTEKWESAGFACGLERLVYGGLQGSGTSTRLQSNTPWTRPYL